MPPDSQTRLEAARERCLSLALEPLRAALVGPDARAVVTLSASVGGAALARALARVGREGLYAARAARVGRCVVVLRGGGGVTFAEFKACVVSAARAGAGVLEIDFGGVEVEGTGVLDFAGVGGELRGLGIDGVGVVEIRALAGVGRGLRWVSLRGTKIGCLWAAVEGLRVCPQLAEVWIGGGCVEEVEALRVEVEGMRMGDERKEESSDDGRMDVDYAISLARESMGLLGSDEEVDSDDEDDAASAVSADGATPLSLVPHFHPFLVARLSNLRRLDNVAITPEARAAALLLHDATFQPPPRAPPLHALLAARELGGATVPQLKRRARAKPAVQSAPVPVPGSQQVNKRPRDMLGSTPATPSPGATGGIFWALNAINSSLHSGTRPNAAADEVGTSGASRMVTDGISRSRLVSSAPEHNLGDTRVSRPAPLSCDGEDRVRPASHFGSGGADFDTVDAARGDGGSSSGHTGRHISPVRTASSSRAAKRPALMLESSAEDTMSEDAANRFFWSVDSAAMVAAAKAAAALIAPPTPPGRLPEKPASAPPRLSLKTREAVERVCRHTVSSFSPKSFRELATGATVSRPGAPLMDFLTEPGDRPRQFEYSPLIPEHLVYGTVTGDIVVLNQATRAVVGTCHSGGSPAPRNSRVVTRMPSATDCEMAEKRALTAGGWAPLSVLRAFEWTTSVRSEPNPHAGHYTPSILGLSWLHKTPGRFLAGTDSGAVHMYDVERMAYAHRNGCMRTYVTFHDLTSIHVNADDSKLVTSGKSSDVGLFDIESGIQTETLRDLHTNDINVIKFANHNPHILVTSSFDKYVKKWDLRESRPGGSRRPVFERRSDKSNVMVCFSPDDEYILVSAVDNEVRQYFAGDGRLERKFAIPASGESTNYTRSYYMNNRDYIITGSCKEDVVRVYNARTGQYVRGIDFDPDRSGRFYVQSLRANPLRDFNLTALLACDRRNRDDFPSNARFEMLANVDLSARSLASDGCTSVFA